MRQTGLNQSIGKSKSQAFTLVELLVVMSIVSLLIALLLPALGKSRQSAMNAQCNVNARTLSSGMVMYTYDFKDQIAYTSTINVVGPVLVDYASWCDRLAGVSTISVNSGIATIVNSWTTYVPWQFSGLNQSWCCPFGNTEVRGISSDVIRTTWNTAQPTIGYKVNAQYGLNACIAPYAFNGANGAFVWGSANPSSTSPVWTQSGVTWYDYNPHRLSEVYRPSRTALIGDGTFANNFTTSTKARYSYFMNQNNVYAWDNGSPSWAPWPIVRPAMGSGLSLPLPTLTSVQPTDGAFHNSTVSMSFCDGHVQSVKGVSSQMFMNTPN